MEFESDKNEGIISPFRRRTDPSVREDILLIMTPVDLRGITFLTHGKEIPLPDLGLSRLFQAQKPAISYAGPCLGAPQAVIALEKLIALGAKRIWVLGWCGSTHPSLRIGDLLIPTSAVSEEGTSPHYPIGERSPEADRGMGDEMEVALGEKGMPARRGLIWTTDAPYRETREKVSRHQERGVLAVEMEMSALMTVAIYRSVSLAALLVVSDELFDFRWRTGFADPSFKKASLLSREVLLRLASDWSKNIDHSGSDGE